MTIGSKGLQMKRAILLGGAMLVGCDLLSRVGFRWLGTEAPVGAVTALFGGPAFLWLLRRSARHGGF